MFPITVPPLRDRPGDIPLLASYFIERFCRELKKKTLTLAPDATDALVAYGWRGNVRELQNCIERAVILTEGDAIHARHLNLSSRLGAQEPAAPADTGPWDQVDLSGTLAEVSKRALAEVERRKIVQALKEAGGKCRPGGRGPPGELQAPLAEGARLRSRLTRLRAHGTSCSAVNSTISGGSTV